MTSQRQLLDLIAQSEGYPNWNAFFVDRQDVLTDSAVPAICTTCEAITEMEPDQDEGWCEECDSNRVKSCLILAGLI